MSGDPGWLVPVASALLGGGLFVGLSKFINSLSESRKSRKEETNIFLGGAEQVVGLMERMLSRAEQQIEELKKEREEEYERSRQKDIRIAELEKELTKLRTLLSEFSARLENTQKRVEEYKHDTDPRDAQ